MVVTHNCKWCTQSRFHCRFEQITWIKKGVWKRNTLSIMDSCLSINFILSQFISKLNLREKFGVQGVSRRWKDIAIQCFRRHEYLVISDCRNAEYGGTHFSRDDNCDEHPSLITVRNNNFVWSKHTDLEFCQRILSLLQGVKCVCIDAYTDHTRTIQSL